jgi:virulence factor Mce-like protein
MVLFSLSCFGLLLFLWLSFGGSIPLQPKRYVLNVNFPEATTLAEQADVRISGVPVGKVRKKALDKGGNRTKVVLDIDAKYAPLPKDTRAILRQKTLLGETFVELTPGNPRSGKLKDNSTLANGQVEPTVELDEILRIFDPATKTAFRQWVKSSAVQIRGGAAQDLNDALGNLAGFAQDGADVFEVLDTQSQVVSQLVRNTGVVFHSLNERRGQLRSLIETSNETFEATASQERALADTFAVFPTFLDESRTTLTRLERFSTNTRPLVNDLKPVADDLGPTVRDLGALAPDLETLFVRLKPVIERAPKDLPHAARFLRGASPAFDALHVLLPQLNPILSFLNYDQQVVAHFMANSAPALQYRIGGQPSTHMLPQFGMINGKSLSFQQTEPDYLRANAYVEPNNYNRAVTLGMIESFSCKPAGGVKRTPSDVNNNPLPPCFEAPDTLYDGNHYPTIGKGEVRRKPPPTNSAEPSSVPPYPDRHP